MQGKNASQCHPLASIFNAADAVLGRKIRQNVDYQQPLITAQFFLQRLHISNTVSHLHAKAFNRRIIFRFACFNQIILRG